MFSALLLVAASTIFFECALWRPRRCCHFLSFVLKLNKDRKSSCCLGHKTNPWWILFSKYSVRTLTVYPSFFICCFNTRGVNNRLYVSTVAMHICLHSVCRVIFFFLAHLHNKNISVVTFQPWRLVSTFQKRSVKIRFSFRFFFLNSHRRSFIVLCKSPLHPWKY